MSISALKSASFKKSVLPKTLVNDPRSIQRGHSSVFFRDCILSMVESICNEETSLHDQFKTALYAASSLSDIHREMALRGLKVYLFGGMDRANEERILGAFGREVMSELAQEDGIDMREFELIQATWNEFEYATNNGRFAPIAECFILGEFPMDTISPSLMVFDKKAQEDLLTPVTWIVYAQSYLNRDQAGIETGDHDLKVNHMLNDLKMQVIQAIAKDRD